MSKTRRLISILVAAVLAVACMVSAVFFTLSARAETGSWSALNTDTTVDGGKIKSAVDAGKNEYTAKYSETISLADGFKVDFVIDSFQGTGTSAWNLVTESNGVAFALTGSEASATAQNAYVFVYTKKDDNTVKMYTYWTKDFKLEDGGKISFTEESGYNDNTTRDGSFDTTLAWEEGMDMSLAGDIVNGYPMFWMNGSAVNRFGNSIWSGEAQTTANMLGKLQQYYADFTVADEEMNLYAFNLAEEGTSGEFAVDVKSVATEYESAKAGWVATDPSTAVTSENDVVFSNIRPKMDGGNSRAAFIYEKTFDLKTESIQFQYSTHKDYTADWISMVSIRGVGMHQFTSAKVVGGTHYENFLFGGGITVGLFDKTRENAKELDDKGDHGIVGGFPKATVDGDWATWTIWFGKNSAGKYEYRINGSQNGVIEYSEERVKEVLGEDMIAEVMLVPNSEIVLGGTDYSAVRQYKLYNFAQLISADKTSAEYENGSNVDLTFNLTMPSADISVAKLSVGGEDLVKDTDYTLEDNVLTLKGAFLNTLDLGVNTIVVHASNGTTMKLTINSLASIEIDAGDSALVGNVKDMTEITLTVTLGAAGDELKSVTLDGSAIAFEKTSDSVYTVVIDVAVLNKLHVGEHILRVDSKYGYNTTMITVHAVAKDVPVWDASQSNLVEINLQNAADLSFKVDLKDAVDYYVTVDGREITTATFDKKPNGEVSTVTIPKAEVGKFAIGDRKIAIWSDAGRTAEEVTVRTSLSFDNWDVRYSNAQAPVLNGEGTILMTGETMLDYKEHVDLSEGYTLKLRFGDIYDWDQITGSYVEFRVTIAQGPARYELFMRTYADGSVDYSFATVQLHQHVYVEGATSNPVAADVGMRSVPLDEDQVWSIKLLDNRMLTMFNHKENRENGMPVDDMGGVAFDDATIAVGFSTGTSKDHKNDSTGMLVSFGAFEEKVGDIPAWAKSYFLDPIAAPVLRVDGNTVVWDAVTGASQYIVYINGEPAEYVDADSRVFDFSSYGEIGDTLSIQVKAIGDGLTGGDSALSEALEVTIQKGKTGCSGSISFASAAVSAVVLLGVVTLMVVIRKKEVR